MDKKLRTEKRSRVIRTSNPKVVEHIAVLGSHRLKLRISDFYNILGGCIIYFEPRLKIHIYLANSRFPNNRNGSV